MAQRYITLSAQACDVFNEINFQPAAINDVYLIGPSQRLLRPEFTQATGASPDARYDDSFNTFNGLQLELDMYKFNILFNAQITKSDPAGSRGNFRYLVPFNLTSSAHNDVARAGSPGLRATPGSYDTVFNRNALSATNYPLLRSAFKGQANSTFTRDDGQDLFPAAAAMVGKMITLPANTSYPLQGSTTSPNFSVIYPPPSPLMETAANSKTYTVVQNTADNNLKPAFENSLVYPTGVIETTPLWLKFKPDSVVSSGNQNNQSVYLTIEREGNRYFFKTVNTAIITNYNVDKIPVFNLVRVVDTTRMIVKFELRLSRGNENSNLFNNFKASPPDGSRIVSTSPTVNEEIATLIDSQIAATGLLQMQFIMPSTTNSVSRVNSSTSNAGLLSNYRIITNGPGADFKDVNSTYILPDPENNPNDYESFNRNKGLSGLRDTAFEFVTSKPVAGSVNLLVQNALPIMIKSIPIKKTNNVNEQSKPYYLYWNGGASDLSTNATFSLKDYWLDDLTNQNIRRGLQFWWLDNTILSGKTEDYYRWTLHYNLAVPRITAGTATTPGGTTNIYVKSDGSSLLLGNIPAPPNTPTGSQPAVSGLEGWVLQDQPQNISPGLVPVGAKALVYVTNTNTPIGFLQAPGGSDAVNLVKPAAGVTFDTLPTAAYQWYCVNCTINESASGSGMCQTFNDPNANLRTVFGTKESIESTFKFTQTLTNVNIIAMNGPIYSIGAMNYLTADAINFQLSNTPPAQTNSITIETITGTTDDSVRIKLGTNYIGVAPPNPPNPPSNNIVLAATIPNGPIPNPVVGAPILLETADNIQRFSWKFKVADNIIFNGRYYPVFELSSTRRGDNMRLSFTLPTNRNENRRIVINNDDPSLQRIRFMIVPVAITFNPNTDVFRYDSSPNTTQTPNSSAGTLSGSVSTDAKTGMVSLGQIDESKLSTPQGTKEVAKETTVATVRQTVRINYKTDEYVPSNGVELYFSIADTANNNKVWYISVDTTKSTADRGAARGVQYYNLRLTDDISRRAIFEVVRLDGNTNFEEAARRGDSFALKYKRGPVPSTETDFFVRHAFGVVSIDKTPGVAGRDRDFVWRFLPSLTSQITGTFFCTSMYPFNDPFNGICWSNFNTAAFTATNNVINDNTPGRTKLSLAIYDENTAKNYGIAEGSSTATIA